MASSSKRHVLLTGSPGVGKTTLCQKLFEVLKEKGIQIQGFYTEEVRTSPKGSRVGFDVVTLNGQRGVLARIKGIVVSFTQKPFKLILPSRPHAGKIRPQHQVKSFEQLALPTIKISSVSNTVVVVDEIGKMELFSQSFVNLVRELFASPQATILATVPITKQRPIPFVDELKCREDVTLIEVTRNTSDDLVSEVLRMLETSFCD
ncbi:PREDICTED: cancer-related nucleoside-triphosphatase homolog [Acropora digitifera]|uniref:cancer-related nucleoside-triphosphatase homolog n=1 Tax=Acropora digitifera TaxID=70779 RepID=UPI00077AA1CF|nr:PREDICTED: cancer-related nucleoside-triphosphatase homolog [Acropora digitifera]